eukprot:5492283-Pleurochrysis_carterae.AAC.2
MHVCAPAHVRAGLCAWSSSAFICCVHARVRASALGMAVRASCDQRVSHLGTRVVKVVDAD